MSYLETNERTKCWYNEEGKLHREGGPAMEFDDGEKWWCINGKFHREDGPAVEFNDGRKEWHYNGKFIGYSVYGYTQEKFDRYLNIKEYW